MTEAEKLLDELSRAGVKLRLTDDRERIKFPPGVLTDDLRGRALPLKHELMVLIAEQQDAPLRWRFVRDVYYLHHASCPTCIAAGKGYGLRCGAGTALWASYRHQPQGAQ